MHERNQRRCDFNTNILSTKKKKRLLEFMQIQKAKSIYFTLTVWKLGVGLDKIGNSVWYSSKQPLDAVFIFMWPSELESFIRDRYGPLGNPFPNSFIGSNNLKLATGFLVYFLESLSWFQISAVEFSPPPHSHFSPFLLASKTGSKYKVKWEVGNYPINQVMLFRSTKL